VDISNYVMIEYGQPVHTYDYDKIVDHTMVLRESKKGEKLTTLDGKVHTLPGGDIVIEDGSKRLIDLAGIMGGENSAIDSTTKNVLVFVQTYDPVHIRRTSMKLAHRTQAAGLFEKGLDTELVGSAIKRCIDLFEGLTGGKAKQQILDIYPKKPAMKKVTVSQDFISLYLGTVLPQKDITTILTSLGFGVTWKGNTLTATVPSWRGNDVSIPEDIVEEIARMYGYHNLPSTLMTGALPPTWPDSPFAHESRIRETLTSLTGVEIYTLSLVSEAMTLPTSLQLSNPLGTDAQYLRQALLPSLFSAANDNVSAKERFFLFELANVYIPVKTKLPLESVHLGGVFSGYSFREAKGVVQALLSQLHISYTERVEDGVLFFESKNDLLGILRLHETFVGFEFDTTILRTHSHETGTFVMPSKYPPHVEDFTFIKPEGVAVGNIISEIKTISLISQVEYIDSYQDAYTFRVWYQDPEKTICRLRRAGPNPHRHP
jgi:phenylalanyl-tRNA synthetase beta chain